MLSHHVQPVSVPTRVTGGREAPDLGLVFMTWQHLVSIPPFGTLVPLLLAAAGFHCSVACLVRSPALQQPRQLNLRRVADVDREFRVGSPSTREEVAYYTVSPCPTSLVPNSGYRSS